MLNKCFVIQPFDGAGFDKRYVDVLVPAIASADLEAYRVDQDPSVTIPIAEIKSGIRSSRACVADISLDNPNVWFELGFALACEKDVVMICDKNRRDKFPFDVQHHAIIRYETGSIQDLEFLKTKITERLVCLRDAQGLKVLSQLEQSPVSNMGGLEPIEVAALTSVAAQLDDGISGRMLLDAMEKAGFNSVAFAIGTAQLVKKGLIEKFRENQGGYDSYTVFRLTEIGENWLIENRGILRLVRDSMPDDGASGSGDDMPF